MLGTLLLSSTHHNDCSYHVVRQLTHRFVCWSVWTLQPSPTAIFTRLYATVALRRNWLLMIQSQPRQASLFKGPQVTAVEIKTFATKWIDHIHYQDSVQNCLTELLLPLTKFLPTEINCFTCICLLRIYRSQFNSNLYQTCIIKSYCSEKQLIAYWWKHVIFTLTKLSSRLSAINIFA